MCVWWGVGGRRRRGGTLNFACYLGWAQSSCDNPKAWSICYTKKKKKKKKKKNQVYQPNPQKYLQMLAYPIPLAVLYIYKKCGFHLFSLYNDCIGNISAFITVYNSSSIYPKYTENFDRPPKNSQFESDPPKIPAEWPVQKKNKNK